MFWSDFEPNKSYFNRFKIIFQTCPHITLTYYNVL